MKKQILMVEDDAIVARMYQLRLQLEGFQVEVATDGEAGLSAISRLTPDAIILDLMLPKIDGLAILKRLRATPEYLGIPVVVFTSNYLPNVLEEARKAGANACLSKSDSGPNELIATLKRVCQEAAAQSEPAIASPPQPLPLVTAEELGQTARRISKEVATDAVQLLKTSDVAGGLQKLLTKIHVLAAETVLLEAPAVARLAAPLEVLVKQLVESPDLITASTLRTISRAAHVLQTAFERANIGLKLASLTALAIDDEVFALKAAQDALLRCGMQVEAFDDPVKASRGLELVRFDLVVSDLNMPGLNGFELCERLRKIPSHRETPFILVTALDGFENRVQSARSGADDFIAKPYVPAELGVKALTFIIQRLARGADAKFYPFAR